MNEGQKSVLLKSIAISSGLNAIGIVISEEDRKEAYRHLEEFKNYQGRISACVELLQATSHSISSNNNTVTDVDVTVPTKLYVFSIIKSFLKTDYSKIGDKDRLSIREAIISSGRQLISNSKTKTSNNGESRLIGMKVASVLADIAIRDFPQRWTSFMVELFMPLEQGGIWGSTNANNNNDNENDTENVNIGYKICLECLKIMTEDCTDSDFNSRVSTSRRNDVVLGLNEISPQLLPLIYELLNIQYTILSSTKQTLKEMENYLLSTGRTCSLSTMNDAEQIQYNKQKNKLMTSSKMIYDCLITIEYFCISMPLEWMFNPKQQQHDFISIFLHLLREDVSGINIQSVKCLEALSLRKLDFTMWMRLLQSLPTSVSEAHGIISESCTNRGIVGMDYLVLQFKFHRRLSRLFSHLISAHIAFITAEKEMLQIGNPKHVSLLTFLKITTDMLSHPSGLIASEQINTWITLSRDPQVYKTKILTQYMPDVLNSYINHIVRIRWEDVEERLHPQTILLEVCYSDIDDYESWYCEIRSKSCQFFRQMSAIEPLLATQGICRKVIELINTYGNGQPMDHTINVGPNGSIQYLTQYSEAIMKIEGMQQPLDNVLQGLPAWALDETKQLSDPTKCQIRTEVRSLLNELVQTVLTWTPSDPLLKLRKAFMLECFKYFWRYNTETLTTGIGILLDHLEIKDCYCDSVLPSPDHYVLSDEIISVRKRSGFALISNAKLIPDLLVPWLGPLSEKASSLLSCGNLIPANRMHLSEFLCVVAAAIDDPIARSNFISSALSNSLATIQSKEAHDSFASTEALMTTLGIAQAGADPSFVMDANNVKQIVDKYVYLFSALNQIMTVGRRCRDAARKRPNCGLPPQAFQTMVPPSASTATTNGNTNNGSIDLNSINLQNYPDEGQISLNDLYDDPFVPLWSKTLPILLRVLDSTLRLWHPEYQAVLLANPVQRFVYAISDDEAYLAKKQDSSKGGIFGEGGIAGSVCCGYSRRDNVLTPKWSGWFNELITTCLQMIGLCAEQRALFSPELSNLFPQVVAVLCDPMHLCSMEHRHFIQLLKQSVEPLMLSCPATLYKSHLAPFLRPILEHVQYRLQYTWSPILQNNTTTSVGGGSNSSSTPAPLSTSGCDAAAILASRGGEEWFRSYYARGGLFVGSLDSVTAEAVLDKARVELGRFTCDVVQAGLGLRGEWALVLANKAKQDQALKMNDPSVLTLGPKTRVNINQDGEKKPINADGTPRNTNQEVLDIRILARIQSFSQFLLLDDEKIAGSFVLTMINCLEYPDQYTCRRAIRICHRISETAAHVERYTTILGGTMLQTIVKALTTEPKWMVGVEWDLVALLRDIFCRLCLGQCLIPGGQGPGLQQIRDPKNPAIYEQWKNVNSPLLGGGILCRPTDIPLQILAGLPGVGGRETVDKFCLGMVEHRAVKSQKDAMRDLLRVAAEEMKKAEINNNSNSALPSILCRAVDEESMLKQLTRAPLVPSLPEKLVTQSQLVKEESKVLRQDVADDTTGAMKQLF